jgi:hypothetical protein
MRAMDGAYRRLASAVIVAATCATMAAAQRGSGPSQSSDRAVSPSAVAAYLAHSEDGIVMLDLLVLWRGGPMWFSRAGAHASRGGGGSTTMSQSITYAGRTLTITVDRATSKATINGRELSTADANVVMLDGADADAGPTVVATLRVEPRIEGPDEPMASLIKRSPELYAFIRCDVPPPADPARSAQQNDMTAKMFTVICSQMRPQ